MLKISEKQMKSESKIIEKLKSNYHFTLKDVPEKLRTEKVCISALKYSFEHSINHVPDISIEHQSIFFPNLCFFKLGWCIYKTVFNICFVNCVFSQPGMN